MSSVSEVRNIFQLVRILQAVTVGNYMSFVVDQLRSSNGLSVYFAIILRSILRCIAR